MAYRRHAGVQAYRVAIDDVDGKIPTEKPRSAKAERGQWRVSASQFVAAGGARFIVPSIRPPAVAVGLVNLSSSAVSEVIVRFWFAD